VLITQKTRFDSWWPDHLDPFMGLYVNGRQRGFYPRDQGSTPCGPTMHDWRSGSAAPLQGEGRRFDPSIVHS